MLADRRRRRSPRASWRRSRARRGQAAMSSMRSSISVTARVAARVVGGANVDGKLHMARDDVGRAGPDLETADGGDEDRARCARAPRSPAPSPPPRSCASRRRPIGVAPACPATPSTPTSSRVAPSIAVTTPSGRPSASSTGPCSICASTKAATLGRRSEPPVRDRRRRPSSASRIKTPCASAGRARPPDSLRRARASP